MPTILLIRPTFLPLMATDIATAIPTVDGFQSASVSTSQSLPSIPGASTHALLTVTPGTNGIRFREDASAPTATTGLWVGPGSAVELTNLANIRLIGTDGSTGQTTTVSISYRHYP